MAYTVTIDSEIEPLTNTRRLGDPFTDLTEALEPHAGVVGYLAGTLSVTFTVEVDGWPWERAQRILHDAFAKADVRGIRQVRFDADYLYED